MPITQERLTLLLQTIGHYTQAIERAQEGARRFIEQGSDPRASLFVLRDILADATLPKSLYENYITELAHFKAHGKTNLAKRRYTARKKLLATYTPLAGPHVEGLRKLQLERLQESREAIELPTPEILSPQPPPDTPEEEIRTWERFTGRTYMPQQEPQQHEDEDEAQAAFLLANPQFLSKS